jgi:hypothetical protein
MFLVLCITCTNKLVGARDLRTLWSRLVPHPCLENHVPKKFQVLNHVKPPLWNPSPKIEISHLENHVLKVFRFRSWKPRVWKSCPENHILKFPRSFWVLETRSANSRSPKIEDPTSWKSCPKNFQVWVLETHTMYVPKLKSHVLKIMSLKIPCLGFGEPPSASKLQVAKNWDS